MKTKDAEIELDRLLIKLDNPRHERKANAAAAMKELIENERVVELALDIAKMGGVNPLDLIGVVRDRGSPKDDPTYIAAEGNRRVAALLLLDDPERMPANVTQRASRIRRLRSAAKALGPIGSVKVVIFPSFESADPWIDRMHVASGADGARRRWNPTQQARRNGETSNVEAVELIATARKTGVITPAEADIIAPTNVTRIVSSAARRTQIGLTGSGSELRRTLPWDVFCIGLEKLMRDQLDEPAKHNSRALHNADRLNAYVATIVRALGAPAPLPNGESRTLMPTKAERDEAAQSGDEEDGTEAEEDVPKATGGDEAGGEDAAGGSGAGSENLDNGRGKGDNNAPRGGTVAKDEALERAIAALDNPSMSELYGSITTVSANQHSALVCIGCSTLLEHLLKATGWDGKGKIVDRVMGLPEVKARYEPASLGSISSILGGLRARANLGKHDSKTGGVHGGALIKDMATLSGVFAAVAEVAVLHKAQGK
ncbi:hypothetical protein [uncultured Jannaschia sp.]|uniref:hypothetical protein n=1 Tax=uncultured Jannaschia sp. TaxID=293347 RepID=UPI00260D106F|nr:hypothetical protein [uncultured Jannaschia sp.]